MEISIGFSEKILKQMLLMACKVSKIRHEGHAGSNCEIGLLITRRSEFPAVVDKLMHVVRIKSPDGNELRFVLAYG
jgi:hypothetical protein